MAADTNVPSRIHLDAHLRLYLAVGLGSGLGAVFRYLCSFGMMSLFGTWFPWGTLIVNILGSFVIGYYATLTEPGGRLFLDPAMRQFVLAGFCGGFTTFSIFSLETVLLVEQNRLVSAVGYVVLSLILWLIAVWIGHALARRANRLQ